MAALVTVRSSATLQEVLSVETPGNGVPAGPRLTKPAQLGSTTLITERLSDTAVAPSGMPQCPSRRTWSGAPDWIGSLPLVSGTPGVPPSARVSRTRHGVMALKIWSLARFAARAGGVAAARDRMTAAAAANAGHCLVGTGVSSFFW